VVNKEDLFEFMDSHLMEGVFLALFTLYVFLSL